MVEWDMPYFHDAIGWHRIPEDQKEPCHTRCREALDEYELILIQNDEDDITWLVEFGQLPRNDQTKVGDASSSQN